jgi:hypothetical protein
LLSGFCREVIEQTIGGTVRVAHTLCQSRGDALCRWESEIVEVSASVAGKLQSTGPDDDDSNEDRTEVST